MVITNRKGLYSMRDTRLKDVSAMLVRGEDKYGYWGRDPEPKEDFDPVCIATMQETRTRFRAATKDKVISGITS